MALIPQCGFACLVYAGRLGAGSSETAAGSFALMEARRA